MNTQNAYTDLVKKAVDLMKNGNVAEYIRTLIHLQELKHATRALSGNGNLPA